MLEKWNEELGNGHQLPRKELRTPGFFFFLFFLYSLLSFCLFFWLFFSCIYNTSFPIAQKRLTARSREEEQHEIRLHAQDISFFSFQGKMGGYLSLALVCSSCVAGWLLLVCISALMEHTHSAQHTKKIERRRTARKWKGGHEHNIQKKKK